MHVTLQLQPSNSISSKMPVNSLQLKDHAQILFLVVLMVSAAGCFARWCTNQGLCPEHHWGLCPRPWHTCVPPCSPPYWIRHWCQSYVINCLQHRNYVHEYCIQKHEWNVNVLVYNRSLWSTITTTNAAKKTVMFHVHSELHRNKYSSQCHIINITTVKQQLNNS
jgi:hypothetical protein